MNHELDHIEQQKEFRHYKDLEEREEHMQLWAVAMQLDDSPAYEIGFFYAEDSDEASVRAKSDLEQRGFDDGLVLATEICP